MKKFISALIATTMLVSTFSGCGQTKPAAPASTPVPSATTATAATPAAATPAPTPAATADTKQITLQYWTHLEPAWNKSDEEMIAAFEKENPNIKIEVQSFPYDDFQQKIQTSLLSKSGGADIYKLWGGWAQDFSKTGAFSPVQKDLIADLQNDSYEPTLQGFKYQDKYYGVPLEFNAEYGGLLVNKPFFDKNKIAYPTTWKEMIDIATKNSVSDGAVFKMRGFDFINADTLPYTWLSMILSSGGNYVSADGTKFDFNTQIAKDTLAELVKYVKVNKVTNIDGIAGNPDIENQQWLFMKQALMVPRGAWSIPSGEIDYKIKYGTDFDYISEPFYGTQKLWAAETGWGLSVNNKSANSEAAWKFVTFMMKPENLMKIDISCGMLPPRKSVAHNPEFVKAVPYAAPIINVMDGGKFVGYINTDTLKEDICNTFVDMVQNGTSVDVAVKKLNDTIASGQQ